MSEKPHRCGDSGGRTKTGQPCRFRVAEKGSRCSRHDPRWAGPDPEETGPDDEVRKPKGARWDKAVSAAYLRLTDSTIAKSADGAGLGERTLKRWEGCSWWVEALREAEERWLNHTVARAMRTVHRAAGDDVPTAMKIVERRLDRLAPPKIRAETANLDVDMAQLDEDELQELVNGTPLMTIIARRAARMREEGEE